MKKQVRNQILVADKIFITPEFKRKKKVYKWNFILSVFLIVYLFSYYIYAEYDKNKSEEVSQTLLAEANFNKKAPTQEVPVAMKKDDVVIVMLNQNETQQSEVVQEINVDDIIEQVDIDTSVYSAPDGTEYRTAALIKIPKINIEYPVIAPIDKNLLDYTAVLKIAPCRYEGPEPNEVGNYCIVGHNYRNKKFFSHVPDLVKGDVVELTDPTGRKVNYKVYDSYIVDPSNTECTNQKTNGKRELTLITCTNDSTKRVIVKCIDERFFNV